MVGRRNSPIARALIYTPGVYAAWTAKTDRQEEQQRLINDEETNNGEKMTDAHGVHKVSKPMARLRLIQIKNWSKPKKNPRKRKRQARNRKFKVRK